MNINSIQERREAVTAINDFDVRTGVLKSQRAKYEKPLWFYILAILNGRDNSVAHSVQCIVDRLKNHGIVVGWPAVNRTFNIMMDTNKQIHPHRRGCGIGCHEAVARLGGVRMVTANPNGLGRPPVLFYLGANQIDVNYYRRAWNIKID
jgi:hypothetical protein